MTAGKTAYFVATGIIFVLGFWGILGFLPQAPALLVMGVFMIVGFGFWGRPWLVGAVVLTAATYAVINIVLFTTGLGEAPDVVAFREWVNRTSFLAAGAVALVSFSTALGLEAMARRRRSSDE